MSSAVIMPGMSPWPMSSMLSDMSPMSWPALAWSRMVSGTSSPHLVSQSAMVSISGPWAARMSSARAWTSGSRSRSRVRSTIESAWAWWVIMSLAKVTSASLCSVVLTSAELLELPESVSSPQAVRPAPRARVRASALRARVRVWGLACMEVLLRCQVGVAGRRARHPAVGRSRRGAAVAGGRRACQHLMTENCPLVGWAGAAYPLQQRAARTAAGWNAAGSSGRMMRRRAATRSVSAAAASMTTHSITMPLMSCPEPAGVPFSAVAGDECEAAAAWA